VVEHSTADGESKGSNPATGTGREKITKRCFEKARGSSKVVDRSNTDLESEGSNPVSHILAEAEHGRERRWPKECLACSQIGFKENFILLFRK
jgi:hypothetical protein